MYATPRKALWLLAGSLLLGGPFAAAAAADAQGLDLTIEVLGKHDRIDDRIVNRIAVPGVQFDPQAPRADLLPQGVLQGLPVVPALIDPLLQTLQKSAELLDQRLQDNQDRRRDDRERSRESR